MHKPLENLPHNRRLVLLDQEKLIVRMVESVKRNLDLFPSFKPLPDPT